MTTDLEKQFFDTFGIEPKLVISLEDWESCKDLPRAEELFKHYPQITDRILLELEDIIHSEYNILVYEKFMDSIKITAYPMDDNLPCDPAYFTVMAQADNKREALLVLAMDINVQHYIKQQIQALFKEER